MEENLIQWNSVGLEYFYCRKLSLMVANQDIVSLIDGTFGTLVFRYGLCFCDIPQKYTVDAIIFK